MISFLSLLAERKNHEQTEQNRERMAERTGTSGADYGTNSEQAKRTSEADSGAN